MNELVIFNYLLITAFNSSFKCYELPVHERAHVLIPSRGANGMVPNGHVILSPTPASHSSNLKTCPSIHLSCIHALQWYLVGSKKSIKTLHQLTSPHIPCTDIHPEIIERYLQWGGHWDFWITDLLKNSHETDI